MGQYSWNYKSYKQTMLCWNCSNIKMYLNIFIFPHHLKSHHQHILPIPCVTNAQASAGQSGFVKKKTPIWLIMATFLPETCWKVILPISVTFTQPVISNESIDVIIKSFIFISDFNG